jgi:hypothetical protein
VRALIDQLAAAGQFGIVLYGDSYLDVAFAFDLADVYATLAAQGRLAGHEVPAGSTRSARVRDWRRPTNI